MAAKRYGIRTPDELKMLATFARDNPACKALRMMATVWSSARRKSGRTVWDGAIFAEFSGDRSREARIIRMRAGTGTPCQELRYNMALKWCRENLEEAG